MKLRKKFLLSLSVLPLLVSAIYFFVQKPNICTREYLRDNSRKYSFCKITDDYLKVNKPETNKLIKTYEYFVLNNEYYKGNNRAILSRELLLLQWSWYWINLYNTIEDNLKNDDTYYKTLLWYLEYDANYVYPYDWSVWMYLIK